MPHSRHASIGSGRSATGAVNRISKTSNVSRSTSTSTSNGSERGDARGGTPGGVLSRMLSTFQKKNSHRGRPGDDNRGTGGGGGGAGSDQKAKYPRLGAIDEDKENWVARFEVTHHPDRPRVDKRTRPELVKGEDEYRADLIHMQGRNEARRVQAAATAAAAAAASGAVSEGEAVPATATAVLSARRNLTPALATDGGVYGGSARRLKGPSIRTDIDSFMPNFSYSSCSPKGSRENLSSSSASPVIGRTEWRHPGWGGRAVAAAAAAAAKGSVRSSPGVEEDSPVSPSAMTIQVAFHPESIYHELPASAPQPGEGGGAGPFSLPFTFPVDPATAQRLGLSDSDRGYDDGDGDDYGGNMNEEAAVAATRPTSHSRNDNKTRPERRRPNSASAARGGSQTRATRAHHKRATRDSRSPSYVDARVRTPHRSSALSPAPSLVNSSPDSERAGRFSPSTPVGDMELSRRSSGSSSYSVGDSFLLFYPGARSETRSTCPMPSCRVPLMTLDDLKHNLCSSCRRELQPRESTFYGGGGSGGSGSNYDSTYESDLEILIQRHPAIIEEAGHRAFKTVKSSRPVLSRGTSDDSTTRAGSVSAALEENNNRNIQRTEVSSRAAAANNSLSSRFNNNNGGEFRLQPAPLGRARSKRLAGQESPAVTLSPPRRGDSSSVPPPSHRPPPPPPPLLRPSASSSSLLAPPSSAASKSSSGSSHIGFQLAHRQETPSPLYSPFPSLTPALASAPGPGPDPGPLLEAKTFRPTPVLSPRRPARRQQQQQRQRQRQKQPGSPVRSGISSMKISSPSVPTTRPCRPPQRKHSSHPPQPAASPRLLNNPGSNSNSNSNPNPQSRSHPHPYRHHQSHEPQPAPPPPPPPPPPPSPPLRRGRGRHRRPSSANSASSDDLYGDIASIIDCYVRAERMSAWDSERRKADAVAAYFAEDPEEVEMRRRGFF